MAYSSTYTLTYGDIIENNPGMVKAGTLSADGFNTNDLTSAYRWFTARGITTTIYDLSSGIIDPTPEEHAYLLVAKNALSVITNPDELFQELEGLTKDTHALMRGQVKTKRARSNLCFDDVAMKADYAAGQGTIVAFSDVPHVNNIRQVLPDILGAKAQALKCELNHYFDLKKCGIGFHGDAERRLVVGVRVGATIPLAYQWYQHWRPISEKFVLNLDHGDMYVMSEKAVGHEWKSSSIRTLRHAAGCAKYLKNKYE